MPWCDWDVVAQPYDKTVRERASTKAILRISLAYVGVENGNLSGQIDLELSVQAAIIALQEVEVFRIVIRLNLDLGQRKLNLGRQAVVLDG